MLRGEGEKEGRKKASGHGRGLEESSSLAETANYTNVPMFPGAAILNNPLNSGASLIPFNRLQQRTHLP